MSLLKIIKHNVSPPDKFFYIVPEDRWKIETFAISDLLSQVKAHYERNSYTLPDNWQAVIEDQNCQRLSGEWCQYETGEDFMDGVNARFGIEDIVNGTRVLASFTLDGANVVSQELAESRANTCSRCYMNLAVPGCASCYQLLNVVAMVTGTRGTSEDANLKSCAICHCSNKAQVWIPAANLAAGTTAEQMRQFGRVGFCWKRKEIEAL